MKKNQTIAIPYFSVISLAVLIPLQTIQQILDEKTLFSLENSFPAFFVVILKKISSFVLRKFVSDMTS